MLVSSFKSQILIALVTLSPIFIETFANFDTTTTISGELSGKNGKGKPSITILAVLNIGGRVFSLGSLCTESMRLALSMLNNSTLSVFQNYNVNVKIADDECSRSRAISSIIRQINTDDQHVPLVLFSMCSYFHLANVVHHFDHIGVSFDYFHSNRSFFFFFFKIPSVGLHDDRSDDFLSQ